MTDDHARRELCGLRNNLAAALDMLFIPALTEDGRRIDTADRLDLLLHSSLDANDIPRAFDSGTPMAVVDRLRELNRLNNEVDRV